MAIQTGSAWSLVEAAGRGVIEEPAQIVVAPLKRPEGIVGVVICTAAGSDTFGPGEGQLLSQFLLSLAIKVEQALHGLLRPQLPDTPVTSPTLFFTGSDEWPSAPSEQDALLSMIGHDFRTPLSVIKGYVGLLQIYGFPETAEKAAEALTAECQQHYLRSIMEQVQHLEILVEDLLDLARVQSGK
ncbi:sensor histidine kinase [Dictyobacter kobayashii]|nr:histidine kinase dimerization/phospho-acceptor domain-containing protein [Dictyobacter kobayashii]